MNGWWTGVDQLLGEIPGQWVRRAAQEAQWMGILGWSLVAVGCLGVALAIQWSGRARRKRPPFLPYRPPALPGPFQLVRGKKQGRR